MNLTLVRSGHSFEVRGSKFEVRAKFEAEEEVLREQAGLSTSTGAWPNQGYRSGRSHHGLLPNRLGESPIENERLRFHEIASSKERDSIQVICRSIYTWSFNSPCLMFSTKGVTRTFSNAGW